VRRLTSVAVAVGVTVAASASAGAAHAAAAGSIASPSIAAAAASIAAPSRAHGATIARIVVPAEARSRAGAGAKVWLVGTATSWSAEPQSLLVLGSATYRGREWVHLLLPIRPDGTTGWVPRSHVVLTTTRYWITVDKAARTVTIYDRGRQVRRFLAVIGKPATPTPDGLAAIWERDPQPDPQGFLGPWAMPLTVLSNVLFNFGGGPGRIAIHGRGGASLENPLGSAASHGCVRIDDDEIEWMAAHIQPGTPVDIKG
jgi:lipoprotein-anchoring transpeptidase ErfK/SrfK